MTQNPAFKIVRDLPMSERTPQTWAARTITANDLQSKTFDPLRYVVPGYVPEGATLLVSRPKLGKSWLVLDLCIAIAAGRFTLGTLKPTMGDVLYLAMEDGERRLQRRMTKLLPTFGEAWPSRLTLATDWKRANEGGLDDIKAWCASVHKPAAVVVDTLEKFRTRHNSQNNSYSFDYDAVAGLQKIAIEYGIAIIIVHHDRKANADDPFDTISGTLGLTGAADTILILKREARGVILYVRGRDIEESESLMQFNKESCKWTIQGPAAELCKSNERTAILEAVAACDGPIKVEAIMAATGSTRVATDSLLSRMVEDGDLVRVGRGLYSLPGDGLQDAQDCKKDAND
jgi:RecA-family ATPase